MRRSLLAAAVSLTLLAACDPQPVSTVKVQFVPWVTGLSSPIALADRGGIPYLAERGGTVKVITLAGAQTVLTIPGVSTGGERGLLGLAFSLDGSKLFVDHTDDVGDIHVAEYTMGPGLGVNAQSRRELLTIEHRQFNNHNGGGLLVDKAGLLYIAVGDGGSGGDPNGNAQRLDTLLGKLLRIDPTPTASMPYSIPPSNPFTKTPGARPEIYAYGLRNPWRFSIDSQTDDLWIGDVGQDAVEEVDYEAAPRTGGQNYGWNALEGTHPYGSPAIGPTVAPITEYTHQGGECAVTGGAIVRAGGGSLGALEGAYVFADYCSGRVRALRQAKGAVTEINQNLGAVKSPVAFDAAGGSLLVVSLNGTIYRAVIQ
jgi:glucose/arabinose dehydrogenase